MNSIDRYKMQRGISDRASSKQDIIDNYITAKSNHNDFINKIISSEDFQNKLQDKLLNEIINTFEEVIKKNSK